MAFVAGSDPTVPLLKIRFRATGEIYGAPRHSSPPEYNASSQWFPKPIEYLQVLSNRSEVAALRLA